MSSGVTRQQGKGVGRLVINQESDIAQLISGFRIILNSALAIQKEDKDKDGNTVKVNETIGELSSDDTSYR